jgi:DNA mismatch repair protein MutH
MTLKDFAEKFKINVPNGKSAAATIVKRAIGFKNVGAPIRELDQLGIEVRVIPLRTRDLQPLEAVSFPAFDLKELAIERWEEAELVEYLDRILFIPLLREDRGVNISRAVIGKAFIWSPSDDEWKIIKREWEQYRREVRQGKARTGLTKGSRTQIVHVRPHARNKADTDIDPFGYKVVKQSFWLNKGFIAKLAKENLGDDQIGKRQRTY